jgi:hypothetical protein
MGIGMGIGLAIFIFGLRVSGAGLCSSETRRQISEQMVSH